MGSGQIEEAMEVWSAGKSKGAVTVVAAGPGELDVHGLSAEGAVLELRIHLRELRRRWAGGQTAPGRGLRVITGWGRHSEGGEAVLKPAVLRFLDEECGVRAAEDPGNGGVVVVSKKALDHWLTAQTASL